MKMQISFGFTEKKFFKKIKIYFKKVLMLRFFFTYINITNINLP